MAHFFKPAGSNADGYLVDNIICPGSVSTLTVPAGSSRDIAVFAADKLLLQSLDEGVAEARLISSPGNDRILSVTGRNVGTTAIEARLADPADPNNWANASVWARLKVDIVRGKRSTKFNEVRFNELWKNHPSNGSPVEDHPCKKPGPGGGLVDGAPNQCAVRFSAAFQKSGVDFVGYKGLECKVPGHRGHFLDPYSLAHWLAKPGQLGPPKKFIKSTPAGRADADYGLNARQAILGKHGIVVFWYFWDPMQDGNMWGGHMDLWNGYRQARGIDSYFDRSKEVWFWELTK